MADRTGHAGNQPADLPLPEDAIRLAAEQHVEYHGFTDPAPEDLAIAEDMLAAAAPLLRAQGAAAERGKLAEVISPERFRQLAAWFDEDDAVKMMLRAEDPTLPSTWVSRGTELQEDLRRFADLLGDPS